MAFRIFISYATQDLEIVNQIRDMLRNPYVETFFAEHSVAPGESLLEKIYSAIRDTNLFLLLWSKNSQQSEWVARELELARAESKLIVPIKLDSESILPGTISDIKYIPYHEDPEKVPDWIQKNIFSKAESFPWEPIVLTIIGGAILWLATRE